MTKRFYMAGTEGTGAYVVLAQTSRGRIGIRVLRGGDQDLSSIDLARIRVEPTGGSKVLKALSAALPATSWKQPGNNDQHRFSVVATNDDARDRLASGLRAIGVGSLKTTTNPKAPAWAKDLVEELGAA